MSGRVFLLAGDYSGDIHAAAVVRALRAGRPSLQVSAVGGEHLEQEGVELVSNQSKMGKFGLGSLLAAPEHWFLGKKILKHVLDWKPDVILLIDYGMFNLYMAKQFKRSVILKEAGLQVFYFIPPQVWVSRRHRIKAIQAYIDHVFCIFPFEKPLYESYAIPVTYVGHPLARELPPADSRRDFCQRHQLNAERPVLGVFPGSRVSEINFLLDDMIATASLLQQEKPDIQIVLAKAGSIDGQFLNDKLLAAFQRHQIDHQQFNLVVVEQQNHALLSVADVALLASGTVSLEAALYGTPMVIAYRLQPWVYAIAMRITYLKRAGLPNILTDIENPPVTEVLQNDLNPQNLFHALKPLFDSSSPAYQKQVKAFEEIKTLLSADRSAAEQVAEHICNVL